ncbi:Scavenger receptor cysteine-rich domain superfamily protein [Geodia barretti]|uniref:Scavenger receptor cysteine-rich domain superfamily protein n=1 Tax=Geodia barretti TaxID=519541 RepID=A0AA35WNR9_GEOBA|nr:Scavenger receptor cysteine-rich domain superfamily protein [Geodia barretti]
MLCGKQKKIEQHLQRGFGERLSYFNLTHMLISTWHAIDNTNGTVQIVIATEDGKRDTYALLIYNEWNVTEEQRMQIGFSAGCAEKYFPLSSIAGNSNIGVPGVFAFRIDQENIIDPSKAVDCGDLPDPQNGKVNYTSTMLDSLANYTCTADCDFMLTRECLPDGSWSGREPECPDIACRGLENCHPENGWLSLISGSQGLVAKYGCELGYIPNNTRDTRHCECGSWSGDEIRCEEMCPEVGQDKKCGKHSLILACDSRKDGISNTSKFHLNGSYEFFQEPLRSIQAKNAPCHSQTFYHFPVNPLHETSPDIGISGAYFLRIDEIPGACPGLGGPGCDNKALIPVCENVGNGVDRVPNETHSARVNGSFTFFGTPLHYIHIYHNGTVHFNNGSLSIAVFQTMLRDDKDTYLLYDSKGTEPGYFTAQKEYVSCLLRSASITDFNLRDLFIVTWKNYLFATEMKRVTFQLALASDSSSATTYALLLYNGTNLDQDFTPSVVTGFKTGNASCNNQSFYNFPIPLKLNREGPYYYTEGNGAYIYEIDQKPRELHCNCSTLELDDSMSGEINNIVNTLSGSWAQYNCSNQQYQQRLCVNGCWKDSFPTTNGIRFAIDNENKCKKEGIIEVSHNGEWGSVCDDYWNIDDANVACKMLGFLDFGATATRRGRFTSGYRGDWKYWLDDVKCIGDEQSLFDCPRREEGHNCRQRERAGVKCIDGCDIGIRQRDDKIIELYYRGEWRSVCDKHWSENDAKVACRELGKSPDGAIQGIGGEFEVGEVVKYWMQDVNCNGDEESLFACVHRGIGRHSCGRRNRAKVICEGLPFGDDASDECLDGNENGCGMITMEGVVVEEKELKTTYTFFDQPFHSVFVQIVIATQENKSDTYALLIHNITKLSKEDKEQIGFTADDGTYYSLSNITGDSNIGVPGVYVFRIDKPYIDPYMGIRFFNGRENDTQGLIEVYYQGEWRSVCDDYWTDHDAKVACEQLGFSKSNFKTEIRFVDGSDEIIEVRNGSEWRSVCINHWTLNDVEVACRQLGIETDGFHTTVIEREGKGENYWLDFVNCRGDEESLFACHHLGLGEHKCDNGERAGDQMSQISLRKLKDAAITFTL